MPRPGGNPDWKKGSKSPNPQGKPAGAKSLKTQIQEAILDGLSVQVKMGGNETTTLNAFLQTFINAGLENPQSKAGLFLAEKVMSGDVIDKIDGVLNKAKKEDKDFMSFRIYKKLHDIQREIFTTNARTVVLMAGRRSGKTEVMKYKSVDVAITVDNARVLIIAKTVDVGIKQFFQDIRDMIEANGGDVTKTDRNNGTIILSNGSIVSIRGNNSSADRENLRGGKYHLIEIDECQSQPNLLYLIQDICEPMLVDYNGVLILAGTGPRSAGTHWEYIWNTESKLVKKFNFNITDNPFIPNHTEVLAKICEEKGLTLDSPSIQREYLGQIVYDTDAQVFRLTDNNYFTDDQLIKWIDTQPVSDIKFSAGLDFGFEDADGFSIICWSKTRPEKFLVYEYKARRTGITELVAGIQAGLSYIKNNPIFQPIPEASKFTYIHYDTGGAGKKIGQEFKAQYQLPTLGANKTNKRLSVELLQEECRTGNFKVRQGAPFDDEALKTIWGRDENDNLTREFDESYHPDVVDSTLYSMKPVWIAKGVNVKDAPKEPRPFHPDDEFIK